MLARVVLHADSAMHGLNVAACLIFKCPKGLLFLVGVEFGVNYCFALHLFMAASRLT